MISAESAINQIEVGISLQQALDDFKKRFIELNLKNTKGNQSKAAEIMGIQRTYLSRLISKYSIKKLPKNPE